MIPTESQPNVRLLDQAVVVIANVINLLIVGVFAARAFGRKDFEHSLGLALIFFALPLIPGGIVEISVTAPQSVAEE